MLAHCPSIITLVDATRFHLESCYVFLTMTSKHVIRKFKIRLIVNHSKIFVGSTEPISNLKHHQSSLIFTSWHWDHTKTLHLLLDIIQTIMDWRPKYLIMELQNGNKQLTFHSPTVISKCCEWTSDFASNNLTNWFSE